MRVVICGAGVVGASIAYFLSLRGIATTVVDRCGIAAAASGKSGGFLALDWCDGSPLAPLAHASFALHAELARSLETDYGYRTMDTYYVEAREQGPVARSRATPEWLDGRCAVRRVLGTPRTTAQVHPEKFTHALIEAAEAQGTTLQIGRIERVTVSDKPNGAHSVIVDGEAILADVVVVAMGPWSTKTAEWLPLPPVGGLKGESITIRPIRDVPAHALFAEYQTSRGEHYSPEVFPRPDGEVYLCGMPDTSPVPDDPTQVEVNMDACDRLQQLAASFSSSLVGAQRTRSQACYRPICADGLPLLGKVPTVRGAYVATGHNCWGILNAPASGLAMAELIVDGHSQTIDLSPFNPARLMGHSASTARPESTW
ncbi:MAG: NAD(P)/FAD-dependent oxidoreductase [Acidiferrobacterales bacterium]